LNANEASIETKEEEALAAGLFCSYCKRSSRGFELFRFIFGWPSGGDDTTERYACRDCRSLLLSYTDVLNSGPIEKVRDVLYPKGNPWRDASTAPHDGSMALMGDTSLPYKAGIFIGQFDCVGQFEAPGPNMAWDSLSMKWRHFDVWQPLEPLNDGSKGWPDELKAPTAPPEE
jgi:hypothetical protein